MKKEEILEGNRLIAEFMSEKINLGKFGENWGRVISQYTTNEIPNYDLSWDWLMPVINKISEYRIAYPEQANEVCNSKIVVMMEPLYIKVIKFIKWYNVEKLKKYA